MDFFLLLLLKISSAKKPTIFIVNTMKLHIGTIPIANIRVTARCNVIKVRTQLVGLPYVNLQTNDYSFRFR